MSYQLYMDHQSNYWHFNVYNWRTILFLMWCFKWTIKFFEPCTCVLVGDRSRLHETQSLTEAKQCQEVLDMQLQELDRCEAFPQTIDNEVMRLREQLLKYNNELAQITDREYQLAYLVMSWVHVSLCTSKYTGSVDGVPHNKLSCAFSYTPICRHAVWFISIIKCHYKQNLFF